MQSGRLYFHELTLCVPKIGLDDCAHQSVHLHIFEQVFRKVVLLCALFLFFLSILLPDFVREANEFVRVFADFFAVVAYLLLHECDRVLRLLLLLFAFEHVKCLELLDIVVDLDHLFDELVPPSVDFALHHVFRVVYGQLDNLPDLAVYLGLLGLLRDLVDEFDEVIVPVLDLLEHFVVDEELHVLFEFAYHLLLFEFVLEIRTLGLRVPDNLLGLLLAVLPFRVQPQHHFVELERVERYVHLGALHRRQIVNHLFQVRRLRVDDLILSFFILRRDVPIQWIEDFYVIDEEVEECPYLLSILPMKVVILVDVLVIFVILWISLLFSVALILTVTIFESWELLIQLIFENSFEIIFENVEVELVVRWINLGQHWQDGEVFLS